MKESDHPRARHVRRVDIPFRRRARGTTTNRINAPHGWEYLLDNHLENEEERRPEVAHVCVLGEN